MILLSLKVLIILSIVRIQEHVCYVRNFTPDYKEALRLSLLFYETQRSGKLPSTNSIKWRGDSALDDKGINGEDLSGGYYDASDFVKFSFTMAFTTTLLSWGLISYEDAYKRSGQYTGILDAIKWATDYFIKCHVNPNELYGQIGDFEIDHAYWGRPEDMNMTRPAYKIDQTHPGSDLASQVSAALSSSSIVFKNVNKSYSENLLNHAEELYKFAKTYRGSYQEVFPGASLYYELTSYEAEIMWAAAWLYKATGEARFLNDAEFQYNNFDIGKEQSNTFFYEKILVGIQILLASVTGSEEYHNPVKSFCDHAIEKEQRTPKGLLYIDKLGTLSHAANIAFACLQVVQYRNTSAKKYIKFAHEQVNYMLGEKGRSFFIGYGHNYPTRPHHVASSCPDRPLACNWNQLNSSLPNPQILYGALVSGPDENDYYLDTREEFLYNGVSLDYNAGFQGVVAGLIHYLYPKIS